MLAMAAITATAQNSLQRVIGHTVTEDIDVAGAMVGTAGTYTIGAILTPSVLENYKDCRIIGIKVAAGVDLGRTRMFLYDVRDGSPQLLREQTQRLYTGWNELLFNGDGHTIAGTEKLFFGFDYVETEAMIANEKGGIDGVGNLTTGGFVIYNNGRFSDVTGVGNLCVQLIVDVGNMQPHKMAFSFFDTGFRYKKPSEKLEMFSTVMNAGRDDVTSYVVGYRLDNGEAHYSTVEQAVASGATDTWQEAFYLPADIEAGIHTLTVWFDKINGNTQAQPATRQVDFGIYRNTVPRRCAFVEVYNTQALYFGDLLNQAMKSVKGSMGSQAEIINIYPSGSTLGLAETGFLNEMYAYTTPAFSVNRSQFPGEAHVAYDVNDFLGMLPADMIVAILADIISQDVTSPSFATIDLDGEFSRDTRQLKLSVSGQMLDEAQAIYGDVGLTVMLVEDGVIASQQVLGALNRPTTRNDYMHDNVLRAFLTSPRGNTVSASGNQYSVELTADIDPAWNVDKLRVVAFIGKQADGMTPANLAAHDITNATSMPLLDFSAISDIDADSADDSQAVYFTPEGRQASQPLAPGLYIKRLPDGTSAKIMVR